MDGTLLYNLLEVLSGESLAGYGRLTKGRMRIQLIANCSISFKFLAQHVKIVDIGPTDVVGTLSVRPRPRQTKTGAGRKKKKGVGSGRVSASRVGRWACWTWTKGADVGLRQLS
jgi:hypothetical protein